VQVTLAAAIRFDARAAVYHNRRASDPIRPDCAVKQHRAWPRAGDRERIARAIVVNARHRPTSDDVTQRTTRQPLASFAERHVPNPGHLDEMGNVERSDALFAAAVVNIL